MARHVSVSREGKDLESAVRQLEEIVYERTPKVKSRNPRLAIEAANLAFTALLVARAALERREGRGSHWRSDFLERDDAHWLKHIAFRREGQDMKMSFRPVVM